MKQFLEKDVIDLARLVEPISDGCPVGINVRQDNVHADTYYTLYDKYQDFRHLERSDTADTQVVHAEEIFQCCYSLLTKNTKDIELCCWLIEAATYLHGFEGLHDSLCALNELIKNYTDDLYPEPDPDFLDSRISPILILDGGQRHGNLEKPLNLAPVVMIGEEKVSVWDWQKQGLSYQQRVIKQVKHACSETVPIRVDLISQSLAQLQLLEDNLNLLCPDNQLGLTRLKSIANEAHRLLKTITTTLDVSETPELLSGNDGTIKEDNDAEQLTEDPFDVDDDYDRILEHLSIVTNYFGKHRPDSLITASLLRSERWLKMDIADILNEMIVQDDVKFDLQRCFGVQIFSQSTRTDAEDQEDEYDDQYDDSTY